MHDINTWTADLAGVTGDNNGLSRLGDDGKKLVLASGVLSWFSVGSTGLGCSWLLLSLLGEADDLFGEDWISGVGIVGTFAISG